MSKNNRQKEKKQQSRISLRKTGGMVARRCKRGGWQYLDWSTTRKGGGHSGL